MEDGEEGILTSYSYSIQILYTLILVRQPGAVHMWSWVFYIKSDKNNHQRSEVFFCELRVPGLLLLMLCSVLLSLSK